MEQEEGFYSEAADALGSGRRARDARFGTYMAEVRDAVGMKDPPDADEDLAGEAGYGGIAAAFVRATRGGSPEELILNVANRGRLQSLDDDAVVEVTCRVDGSGVRVLPGRQLSAARAEEIARLKEVERMTIRAAVTGSRVLAHDAITAHPLVPSRAIADKILDGYLAAMPELASALS
jgi:6-phospho-beta-glucosidase